MMRASQKKLFLSILRKVAKDVAEGNRRHDHGLCVLIEDECCDRIDACDNIKDYRKRKSMLRRLYRAEETLADFMNCFCPTEEERLEHGMGYCFWLCVQKSPTGMWYSEFHCKEISKNLRLLVLATMIHLLKADMVFGKFGVCQRTG